MICSVDGNNESFVVQVQTAFLLQTEGSLLG